MAIMWEWEMENSVLEAHFWCLWFEIITTVGFISHVGYAVNDLNCLEVINQQIINKIKVSLFMSLNVRDSACLFLRQYNQKKIAADFLSSVVLFSWYKAFLVSMWSLVGWYQRMFCWLLSHYKEVHRVEYLDFMDVKKLFRRFLPVALNWSKCTSGVAWNSDFEAWRNTKSQI